MDFDSVVKNNESLKTLSGAANEIKRQRFTDQVSSKAAGKSTTAVTFDLLFQTKNVLHLIQTRRKACREKGGELVEVNDVIEHNFLMSKIPPLNYDKAAAGFWIGLTDKERNDTFVWISSGQIPTFTLWIPGQPTHVSKLFYEDCAYYYRDVWNDIWCGNELHYICERTLQDIIAQFISSYIAKFIN
ncbi:perlucin-like protein [Mercenaria mercenaria]|uniref:perlucin-like protein n=1 Tax=Mercenaria mercenaria TaxID=6596 RepID=UPI00234F92DA|nr:perlucin-like protein [Mercenaria mercenaria]